MASNILKLLGRARDGVRVDDHLIDGDDTAAMELLQPVRAASHRQSHQASDHVHQTMDHSDIKAPDAMVAATLAATVAPSADAAELDLTSPTNWHLYGGAPGYGINVQPVWPTYTGRGVHVGVYDGGLQYTHPDLDANYDASLHFKYGDTVIDALDPANSAVGLWHGTAVAGLIAAEVTGEEAVGVAYDAKITGVLAYGTALSNSNDYLQKSLAWAKNFDVTNHSYGQTDPALAVAVIPWNLPDNPADFNSSKATPYVTVTPYVAAVRTGMQEAIEHGRYDRGTVFVTSAGNHRIPSGDNTNGDDKIDDAKNGSYDLWHHVSDANFNGPLANHRASIVVGNIAGYGSVRYSSNPGANLLVSAPGSDVGTTDLTGNFGSAVKSELTSGDYFPFGGTSAAAPVVTGVVALMLEANPDLGWRDVREILALSARHVGSDIGSAPQVDESNDWFVNKATDWNGGGRHFSEDYGYGEVDALAAVRLAESWTSQSTSVNEFHSHADKLSITGQTIADGEARSQATFFDVDQMKIETVTVGLNIVHPRLADLHIWMESPNGTTVELLHAGTGAAVFYNGRQYSLNDAALTQGWQFTTTAFAGESSYGSWNIFVQDTNTGVVGKFTDAQLDFYGSKASPDNTYVYTNEFGTLKGVADDASRSALRDTNGGTDTINVAAVTGGAAINLYGGSAYVAGRAMTIAGVENIIGTASGDLLQGDNGNNEIRGMGGSDTIRGWGGNDTIELTRSSHDTVYGGEGKDTLSFSGAANGVSVNLASGFASFSQWVPLAGDITVGSVTFQEIENLTGTRYQDVLIGDSGNNVLDGLGGTNILMGGGGLDTFVIDRRTVNTAIGDGGDTLSFANNTFGAVIDLNQSQQVFEEYSRLAKKMTTVGTLTYTGIDNLIGGSGTDTFTGNANANRIAGGLGSDTVRAGKGNDIIEVLRYGDDTVYGGDDKDTLSFIDANAGVTIDLRTGSATFKDGAVTVGSVKFSEMEHMIGSKFADTLTGDDKDNAIDGAMGGDTIRGMAGNDVIIVSRYEVTTVDGGADNDTLFFSESYADPTLFTTLNIGTVFDLAKTTQQFGLMGYNTGSVTFTSIENLRGNNGVDEFYGNAQNNVLTGEGGADILDGRAGKDTILGGGGADRITGGTGDDTLSGGTEADNFLFARGWGADTVTDFALGIDHLDFRGVTGLTGRSGLSITDTALGAKITLIGTTDSVTLTGVKAGALTDADFLVPSAPAVPGVRLIGTAADDVWTGGAGNDHIEGGDGTNWLTGGAGADELIGGRNTDFLYVDADDTLINGGDGFDYAYLDTSKPYGASFKVAGTNVEYVGGTLVDDVIDASGVNYTTVLMGNYGKDTLIGGNVADRLTGSAGDDTLTGNGGADTFIFGGAYGLDTITDFRSVDGDRIDLREFTTIHGIGDLTRVNTAAGNGEISFVGSPGNAITLLGVHATDLTANDFLFAA